MLNRYATSLFLILDTITMPAVAQVALDTHWADVTFEGFTNVTGAARSPDLSCGTCEQDLNYEVALRALARRAVSSHDTLGARVVLQSSSDDDFDIGEATLIYFNDFGRFEIGDRMGLPDVLLGYAPNNFTFTGAEYGPASGLSLDPAGGLVGQFLDSALAEQVNALSVLGFSASLADDQSAKLIFVPHKRNGYLGGVSIASNATDRRFGTLLQTGLTREWYRAQNVVRIGGSYSFAHSETRAIQDLHSLNVGASATLDDALMLGLAVTYNGTSGLSHSSAANLADALGISASVNYNSGPWTLGGFLQWAQSEGDAGLPGNDRLRAFEFGASYRLDTRLRFFAAVYVFDFDDEGGRVRDRKHDGALWLLGTRATL